MKSKKKKENELGQVDLQRVEALLQSGKLDSRYVEGILEALVKAKSGTPKTQRNAYQVLETFCRNENIEKKK